MNSRGIDSDKEAVIDIPLEEISDFPNHPFKVKLDEDMAEMAESVRRYRVLVPALVRPKEKGGYEMISGHRRKIASELAYKKKIPCIIRDLSDNEAVVIMVDSNLQREHILPSEKAFAYKMKLEAMKRQGQRIDLTSTPVGQKLGKYSVEMLGESVGESKSQIQRYIRLTELIPKILDMVDEGRIAMRPAVEISYLTKNEQHTLLDTMEYEDCTPSHVQAIKMRKLSEEKRLSEDAISSILSEQKPNQIEQFKIPKGRIDKYFSPGTPAKNMKETIIKALELYRKIERNEKTDQKGKILTRGPKIPAK